MKDFLKKYSSYFAMIPLAVFIAVARYKGLLSEDVKSDAWQEPFYYGAFVSLIMIGVHLGLHISFKRVILGLYLFLIGSAVLFALGNEYLLSLLSNYSGAVFFLAIIIASVAGLLWPRWFDKETSLSPQQNLKISNMMILGSIAAFIWSILFNSSGIIVSIVIPFVGLRLFSMLLERQVR